MKGDKEPKKLTPIQKIFSNENYIVALIFVLGLILIASIFLLREYARTHKKPPVNKAKKVDENQVQLPDYRQERELMKLRESVESPKEDRSLQRVNDDLQRIKEEQEMEKLDRLQERLNDRRY